MQFLGLAWLATVVAASAIAPAKHLESRALPPCPPCPGSDRKWLSKFSRGEIGKLPDQNINYDANWYPPVCNVHGYICYELGAGVTFSSGGLSPPVGHWNRKDGTQIYAWPYWQSTLQFVGAEATVNSYPAHCTVYTYAKGPAARVDLHGKTELQGDASDRLDAKCFGSANNIDIGVQRIYLQK